jgi:hypothetical protein
VRPPRAAQAVGEHSCRAAEVRESAADSEAAREAIKAKYRREFRIFMAIEKVARRMKEPRRVAVWIGPADG